MRRQLGDRTPFVSRELELVCLRRLLDSTAAGSGGLALIAGEPGIGKTRLAAEVATEASSRGLRPLTVTAGKARVRLPTFLSSRS